MGDFKTPTFNQFNRLQIRICSESCLFDILILLKASSFNHRMKRTMPWSDEDDDSSSEDESSPSSASEAGEDGASAKPKAKGAPKHKDKASEGIYIHQHNMGFDLFASLF